MAIPPSDDVQVIDLAAGVGDDASSALPPGKDPEAWDQRDQEKAEQVADEDLNSKKKQTYRGPLLFWLAFQSAGVIYGDIGTSPLYVFSSTFTAQPSWDDLVGALSIIIWSLTLIVTVKYCFIVLSADDDGQGGTFALYSLLARHVNIAHRDPNVSSVVRLERYQTTEMKPAARTIRKFLETSATAKLVLKVLGVVGVSMVLADGLLTPAQSVLGAIQGLRVVRPDLGTDAIVGITCAILVLIFAIQPFGTSKLGTAFAPIVGIWLLFNLICGIYNLAKHDYTVLKAFSPHYAFLYLIRNGAEGWKSLGGLLLAFTGVEALFADLGAFGKRAIQLSWLCLAFPSLILAYCGQAAFIAVDPNQEAYTNPFFFTVPPGTFYFGLVISILAAIVASQALITSSFQLLSQAMSMSYFPHIKKVHTSTKFHDQVYMPFANWLLMIGTIIVTAVYNNTTSLGQAYGVCVIIVTFITTCMLFFVATLIWRINLILVLLVFLPFVCLDGAFMSAALHKVPEGAWFTLVLSFVLSTIFILWRWGKEKQWAAEAEDRIGSQDLLSQSRSDLASMASSGSPQTMILSSAFGGGDVSTASGMGIFFDKVGGTGDMIPKVFTQFIRKFKSRPQVIVFFHMRPLSQPTVPREERFIITRVAPSIPSCYRVTLRHGYADAVLTPDLASVLELELMLYVTRGKPETPAMEMPPSARAEMEALHQARDAQMVYVMGKQVMRIQRNRGNIARRLALEAFLFIRENSRTKMENLDIDPNSLVEVGFVKGV